VFHRLLEIRGLHALSIMCAGVLADATPERFFTQRLAQQVQYVSPLLVHHGAVITGRRLPAPIHQRVVGAFGTQRLHPRAPALHLRLVRRFALRLLQVGGGHEIGETFVEPEVLPADARHPVAPPLVGGFVGDQGDVVRVVQHFLPVRL